MGQSLAMVQDHGAALFMYVTLLWLAVKTKRLNGSFGEIIGRRVCVCVRGIALERPKCTLSLTVKKKGRGIHE